jgi:hypothetical protein
VDGKHFLDAGGEEFALIPCLNENPTWLRALERMVPRRWPETSVAEAIDSDPRLMRELVAL